jgi:predicted RNA-binding protein Jag
MEDNEMNQEEINQKMKEWLHKVAQMTAVQYMIENAPRDTNGNVVVSIVGINNFGLFYQFNN